MSHMSSSSPRGDADDEADAASTSCSGSIHSAVLLTTPHGLLMTPPPQYLVPAKPIPIHSGFAQGSPLLTPAPVESGDEGYLSDRTDDNPSPPLQPMLSLQSTVEFTFDTVFVAEEDRECEFKACQNCSSKSLIDHIARYANQYICAFLNTNGGTIYFGIEDNGIVKGLTLSRKTRDSLHLRLDGVINAFRPQVDPAHYRIYFHPVRGTVSNRFIVAIEVEKGVAPVYLNSNSSAYIRRDGGCKKMTQDLIEERLRAGGRPEDDYRDLLIGQTPIELVGRQSEIANASRFVTTARRPVKAIIISGAAGTGKTALAAHLVNELRAKYPRTLMIDVRGSNPDEPFLSASECKMRLIRGALMTQAIQDIPMDESAYGYLFLQPTLLFIENCSRISLLQALIPSVGDALIVVTSRSTLDMSMTPVDLLAIELGPLSKMDGSTLARAVATRLSPRDAIRVTDICSGLPHPIVLLANLIKSRRYHELDTFLTQLEDNPTSRLEHAMDDQLRQQMQALPHHALEPLKILSVFHNSFTSAAFSAVARTEAVRTSVVDLIDPLDALGTLVDFGMLHYSSTNDRYIPYDLITLYAQSLVTSDDISHLRLAFTMYYTGLIARVKAKRLPALLHSESGNIVLSLQWLSHFKHTRPWHEVQDLANRLLSESEDKVPARIDKAFKQFIGMLPPSPGRRRMSIHGDPEMHFIPDLLSATEIESDDDETSQPILSPLNTAHKLAQNIH